MLALTSIGCNCFFDDESRAQVYSIALSLEVMEDDTRAIIVGVGRITRRGGGFSLVEMISSAADAALLDASPSSSSSSAAAAAAAAASAASVASVGCSATSPSSPSCLPSADTVTRAEPRGRRGSWDERRGVRRGVRRGEGWVGRWGSASLYNRKSRRPARTSLASSGPLISCGVDWARSGLWLGLG